MATRHIHCRNCGGPWWIKVDTETGHASMECAQCGTGGAYLKISKEPVVNLEYIGVDCEGCDDKCTCEEH